MEKEIFSIGPLSVLMMSVTNNTQPDTHFNRIIGEAALCFPNKLHLQPESDVRNLPSIG
ncbi:hypothetical protein PVAP13_9NG658850 [Panicum virgatum]|uniref:Uncharacterized protein n=1 Tax=Panicum virgatum TaxID=38727 RepID=A0A8T0N6M0_PANVG|nr:hypothetical protein PVAP13_9NG658850 [Panicum virgatum]